jgi:hypothetical protein
MRSARLVSLVLLIGVIAGGLVLEAAEPPGTEDEPAELDARRTMPTAAPASTLASTWFCAAGTATVDGFADHVLLIANPSDVDRTVTVSVLPGAVAPAPVVADDEVAGTDDPEATEEEGTEESADPTTTTTVTPTPVPEPPAPEVLELPAQSRIEVVLADLVDAELAGAVVEVDGGQIAVDHQITGEGGRATAPCSTDAARSWSVPWGVTERGARQLLVFMNPFPDDATIDIVFSTDEGTRDTLRFQGFVVPGRSVVGAYIDEDVTRRAQVSAQVRARSGRIIVERIQTFDGTDDREGITLGMGASTPAATWMFPDGLVGEGLTEQIVVFNPSADVAEVEVEVRLDAAAVDDLVELPEAFELTIAPDRFSILDLHDEERIPADIPHSIIVRSLNGVPVVAERVVTAGDPATNLGIAVTLGAPLAAPTWYLAGGGVSEERDQWITLFNASPDAIATFSVTALANGQTIPVQDLQGRELAAGGRLAIRLSDHIDREDLPLVVTADGPVVVERGLYRIDGRGMSQSMGIPLAVDLFIPPPVAG